MKRLLAITVIAVILFAVLLWLPEWMSNQYQFDHVKDWAAQVTANRAMLVNLMGGLAVAVTIYFTYRNFKVAEDKSITDVFSKAIEQLGSSDVSVRLGGIHSLARIARSSKEDYFPIMQILTGYLRHRFQCEALAPEPAAKSPAGSHCPVDAQAILNILSDRSGPIPGNYNLDLSYIEIPNGWVPNGDFRDVYFWSAKLTGWNFCEANLRGADFKGATLDCCDFTAANLTGANLEGATIKQPRGLTRAQLETATNVDPGLYEPQ